MPEQQALRGPFVKAFCESKFMFPGESGIYAFLKDFDFHAFRIINFKQTSDPIRDVMPEEFHKLVQMRSEDAIWILGSMDTLLEKLEPYLNFHAL